MAGLAVESSPERCCPRCDAEVLASLRVPHGWTNTHGVQVRGFRELIVCARCDADDPAAGPIVTFFTVHAEASDANIGQLAVLLGRWVAAAQARRVDEAAVDAEAEAYFRGEL
ncbi:DUF6300 family protein [Actinoallomurus vinaceus]